MIAVLINAAAVITAGIIGSLFKKGFSEKITSAVMTAIGLCVIYIGVDGALKGDNTIILIISMLLGAALGTLIDIDGKINRLGTFIENKVNKKDKKTSIAEGFVTSTLLFCVGSMTIVGALNAGLNGDNQMLLTKSLLDFVSGTMIAAACGIGVIFSAIPILVIEGGTVFLAELLSGFLSDGAINEMTCTGSVIIIALGLNMTGAAKIKAANLIPAIVFAPIFYYLFGLLPFHI